MEETVTRTAGMKSFTKRNNIKSYKNDTTVIVMKAYSTVHAEKTKQKLTKIYIYLSFFFT